VDSVYQRCGIPVPPEYGSARPAVLCGQTGYAYLHAVYLRSQCGSCHYAGSRLHPNAFADADLATAYHDAQFMSADAFVKTVREGRFVDADCWLREDEPLDRDLREWLQHPDKC
jgi:hypothetical protein